MNKNIIKSITPISGSIILFLIFFLYGLINNLSFSYMGNSSDYAKNFIMNHFLLTVIIFILQLTALYILAGIIFGVTSLFIVNTVFNDIKKITLSLKIRILLNGLISLILYLPFFLKDLINYPQVYINGFYVKSGFSTGMMNFMADNINPSLFASMQILYAVILSSLIIYKIIKLLEGKVFTRSVKIYASITAVIILTVIVFINAFPDKHYNRGSDAPNVIIFSSDAVRPDHLSGFGYMRNTSPNIDRLLDDGVSFMDARIEVPRTFPSWVSAMTGQFASTHGIRHMFPTSMDVNKNFTTLPGILNSKGYYTSVVADYAGDIFTRINLGFKNVDTPFFNANYMIYQAILDSHIFILPFLTGETGLKLFPVLRDSAYFCPPALVKKRIIKSIERADGKPFFITSFFSSTHFPYAQSYPYYKMFSTKNYRGPYKFLKQQIISLNNNNTGSGISEADKNQVNALYDGGIKAFDKAVGEVTDYLEQKDLLKNTIIIVISDHGENLYEGDLGMGHGEHFRGQYSTRIPFIISNENLVKKNLRIPAVVRQVDIAPTILDMLKIENTAKMDGVSLLPLIEGKSSDLKLYAFGETGIWFDNNQKSGLFFQNQRIIYPDITGLSTVDFNFNNQIVLNDEYRDLINLAKHRYIYDGKYKLIYIPLKDKVTYELYNTEEDPEETVNIIAKDKANFNRLKNELFKWFQRNNDVIIKDEYIFPKTRY
ncbi:MAG TPA: sulfatase-like hydrolase/transferase [Spirochaetota bacterium]|nr:sulfatase-like hydrolase/transferase [Spirochaetota bacterium]HPS86001.1 sulfatase-like hydrolase/transferase [Spirochaetota bacterium]